MKKALLYEKLKDNKVKCTACKHYCIIKEGNFGICKVRKNINGELFSTIYGYSTGDSIDPIEKKPLYHFLPGSEAYSFGTISCNFECQFCQNDWMSMPLKDKNIPIPPLFELSPKKIVENCIDNNIKIIAYTYNEPTISFEHTLDTAKLAHKNKIKNIYISNGYASDEAIKKIAPYLDGINIDLKAFNEDFYHKICKADLNKVKECIKSYYKNKVWLEITSLLIGGLNTNPEEIKKLAEFIASISTDIPWHISKFSPAYKMQNYPPTKEETLHKAYEIGKKAGLKYIYVGNIFGKDIHSTYCPKCKNLLIERDWTYTKVIDLKNGKCGKCGELIPGIWK